MQNIVVHHIIIITQWSYWKMINIVDRFCQLLCLFLTVCQTLIKAGCKAILEMWISHTQKGIITYRSTHMRGQVLRAYKCLDLRPGCKLELADCLRTQPRLHNLPRSWNRVRFTLKMSESHYYLAKLQMVIKIYKFVQNTERRWAHSHHSWSKAYPQWSFWLKR